MKEDPNSLRERFRTAGDNLWTLIFIVLGVGLFLGLATNILAAYLLESQYRGLGLVTSAALVLALTLWFVLRVNSKGYDFATTVELLLPFKVTHGGAEILAVPHYPVTRRAKELFGRLMEDEECRSLFLRDWHGALRDKNRPFQGFVRTCVTDLQCYLVMDVLREYGGRTLTKKGIFTQDGWKPTKMPSRARGSEEWPLMLRENLYVSRLKSSAFRKFHLPEVIRLAATEGQDGGGGEDPIDEIGSGEAVALLDPTVREVRQRKVERAVGEEKHTVSLKTPYGDVSIVYSPFQRKISERSREGDVACKYCGGGEDVWLAKFNLSVTADFGGWKIFGGSFKQDYFPWVVGFIECLRAELDWGACVVRDGERMVVELNGLVGKLLEEQSELKQQVKALVEFSQQSHTSE
jgi:hypothetical protein